MFFEWVSSSLCSVWFLYLEVISGVIRSVYYIIYIKINCDINVYNTKMFTYCISSWFMFILCLHPPHTTISNHNHTTTLLLNHLLSSHAQRTLSLTRRNTHPSTHSSPHAPSELDTTTITTIIIITTTPPYYSILLARPARALIHSPVYSLTHSPHSPTGWGDNRTGRARWGVGRWVGSWVSEGECVLGVWVEYRHVYLLLELVTRPLQIFLAPLQFFFRGTLQIIVIRTWHYIFRKNIFWRSFWRLMICFFSEFIKLAAGGKIF